MIVKEQSLKMVAWSPAVHHSYVEASRSWGIKTDPGPSTEGVWLYDEQDRFVAGVAFFATEGQYMLVEDAVTHRAASPRLRLMATRIICEQIKAYAAMRGKIPRMVVRNDAVARQLSKYGFRAQRASGAYFLHPAEAHFVEQKKLRGPFDPPSSDTVNQNEPRVIDQNEPRTVKVGAKMAKVKASRKKEKT